MVAPGARRAAAYQPWLPRSGLDGLTRERHPELGGLGEVLPEIGGQPEALRHDPDDGEIAPVDADPPVQHERVAAEPALPQPVAQDRDRIAALDLFVRRERAAVQWPCAEGGEDIGRDPCRADPLGLGIRTRQVGLSRAPGPGVASERACR